MRTARVKDIIANVVELIDQNDDDVVICDQELIADLLRPLTPPRRRFDYEDDDSAFYEEQARKKDRAKRLREAKKASWRGGLPSPEKGCGASAFPPLDAEEAAEIGRLMIEEGIEPPLRIAETMLAVT